MRRDLVEMQTLKQRCPAEPALALAFGHRTHLRKALRGVPAQTLISVNILGVAPDRETLARLTCLNAIGTDLV